MGYKSNKCCCEPAPTIGASMWILGLNYGETIQAFDYTKIIGTNPTSTSCCFDPFTNEFFELGGASTIRWDDGNIIPEQAIWGPLQKTNAGTRDRSGFTENYIWYGGTRGIPFGGTTIALYAVNKSDGSNHEHTIHISAAPDPLFLRTDGEIIYTQAGSFLKFINYDEDGNIVAQSIQTQQGVFSYLGDYNHVGSTFVSGFGNKRIYRGINSTTLATEWEFEKEPENTAWGNVIAVDGNGGWYTRKSITVGGLFAGVYKFTEGNDPSDGYDWFIANGADSLINSTPHMWGNGYLYYLNTGTGLFSQRDGADGSLTWSRDLTPELVSDAQIRAVGRDKNLVHNGIIYLPYTHGILALEESSGVVLWNRKDISCGWGAPSIHSSGLLCCGTYSALY